MGFAAACALLVTAVLAGAGACTPRGWVAVWTAGAGGLAILSVPLFAASRRSRPRVEALAWGVLLVGAAGARGSLRAERARPPDLSSAFREERRGWVEGVVREAPSAARSGVRFPLRVTASTLGLPAGTGISVWCEAGSGAPRAGSRIAAHLRLRAPRPCTTPGGFDEAEWLRSRGAALAARLTGAAWRQTRSPPPSPAAYLGRVRERWSARLGARVPGEAGEFLRGLLLGERGRVSPEAIDDLRRAGALHLLALSGQHVVLVAILLAALARGLGARPLAEGLWATAGVWAYSILTGASPSVVRAATASTLAAGARALGRPSSGVAVLVWSAALGAAAQPDLALDVGFQLSCLASAGLAAAGSIGRSLGRVLPAALGRLAPARAAASLGMAVLGTAVAQAAVLPLLAARFGAVSAVGLLSNLVMVPVCAALLALGLPLLVADSLLPVPGCLWRGLAALAGFLLRAGGVFSGWPLAWVPCAMTAGMAVGALACGGVGGAAALVAARAGRGPVRPRLRRWAIAAGGAAVAGWVGLVAAGFVPHREAPRSTLSYWLLDVGQGDAQVLEFCDGRVMVVDMGEARAGFDAGARVVAPFLRARGVRVVDLAVITHEDGDHAGGWRGLARDVPVRAVAGGRETLAALRAQGALRGTRARLRTVAARDTLLAGPGYRVLVLWPPPGDTGLPVNQHAVVLQVEAGADRLVLTADTDSATEAEWLGRVRAPASVVKLAHHGAGSSTGTALLDALRPRRAVVSCGLDNRFGHPHPATLARLRERGIPLWRTDLQGTARLDLGSATAGRRDAAGARHLW